MKTKKGAASFYIVAFSTLILVVIAVSFTLLILSNLARTANDELSQSAYDSALAGVEDAKVAFYNYQKCLSGEVSSGSLTCEEIIDLMKNPDCNMVAAILGRSNESGEVFIKETSEGDNNMQQAYTCVKIQTVLDDYVSSLTEADTTRVVKVRLANGVKAKEIKKVRVSWYSTEDYQVATDLNFSNINNGEIAFPALRGSGVSVAAPPVLSVGLIQTADSFTLEQFEKSEGGRTDRGTVFLVPTDSVMVASGDNYDKRAGAWDGEKNEITASDIAKSNDHAVKNVPFAVYCSGFSGDAYACSADIILPEPIGGERSDDTFSFVISVPYGQPSTSFSLRFFCESGLCGKESGSSNQDSHSELSGMQIEIDSTGRANNLYRRVSARLESSDTYFPYPLYAIELLKPSSGGNENLLVKPAPILREYDF